jgi:hypothetical protein
MQPLTVASVSEIIWWAPRRYSTTRAATHEEPAADCDRNRQRRQPNARKMVDPSAGQSRTNPSTRRIEPKWTSDVDGYDVRGNEQGRVEWALSFGDW